MPKIPASVLDKIVEYKVDELKARKTRVSLEELVRRISKLKVQATEFVEPIVNPKIGDIGLIAEIKLASPYAGRLGVREEILKLVQMYVKGGADVISVITDKRFFNGEVGFIAQVKKIVNVPVLQKDFVVDRYQLYEAKSVGADAILLIAKIVDTRTLRNLVSVGYDLGLEPVVEVASEAELEMALATPARCIGVNARNLNDFTIDIRKACELGKNIPRDRVFIGFSGIQARLDVEEYKRAGAKAVLVGTTLMRTNKNNIVKTIKKLKNI